MNELIPFEFQSCPIRVVRDDNGSFEVVAKDLAESLGYVWNGAVAVKHVPEEWRGVRSVLTPSGIQEMVTLKEPGVYFFLNRSDKPMAIPLQKWVAGEVLPTIRKTGGYSMPDRLPSSVRSRDLVETSRAYRALVSMGRAAGLTPNQSAIAANNYLRKTYSVDCLAMLDSPNLIAPIQERYLRPSEIGMFLGISARDANRLLEQVGFQESYRDHKDRLQWRVTAAGRQYAVITDTAKKHGDGTPVQQILWLESVVQRLPVQHLAPTTETVQ